jgi:hypothetical protein
VDPFKALLFVAADSWQKLDLMFKVLIGEAAAIVVIFGLIVTVLVLVAKGKL